MENKMTGDPGRDAIVPDQMSASLEPLLVELPKEMLPCLKGTLDESRVAAAASLGRPAHCLPGASGRLPARVHNPERKQAAATDNALV